MRLLAILSLTIGLHTFSMGEGENGLENIANDLRVQYEISSLFTSTSPKSSPLYLCDATLGGIEYQPPASVDCETEPRQNDTSYVVDITLYWNDISHHSITGYECSGTTEKLTVLKRLWFAITRKESIEKITLTSEECWKMANEKVSPSGKKLEKLSDDVWETNEKKSLIVPSFVFVAELETQTTNYRLQKVKIGISEADGIIKTIAFTSKPCHYNASYCATEHGILIWKVSDVKTCRLMEGERSNCLLRIGQDGKTLTCPDLTLSIHGYQLKKMCGVFFGYSQGIYFLQNKQGKIDKKIGMPKQIKSMLTRPRRKREAPEKVHAFEAEIKANLNYIYETLKKGTDDAIWRLEHKIFESNRRQLEMVSALAQSGHPSLTTRFWYKNPALRAEYVGDLLTVYQGIEVYEYAFLNRDICTFQWPVRYIYGKIEYTGYVEPLTHTIVPVATNQSAHSGNCRRFYFQTKDYVALFTSTGAVQVSVDKLPQPGLGHGTGLPKITFLPTGNLAASSSDDMESIYNFFREAQQRGLPGRPGKSTRADHIKLKENSFGIMDTLSTMTGGLTGIVSSIFGTFKGIVMWCIYFAIGFFILSFLLQSGLLCKIICLPFSMMRALVNFANRSAKRAKRCCNSRKHRGRRGNYIKLEASADNINY